MDKRFYRICGVIGSGKTQLLKHFITDALREVRDNPDAKLIVFEPKREFYSWIKSLSLDVPVRYFMPSDRRSVAINFTRDYPSDLDSMTLAHAFYPQAEKETNEFWGKALRTVYSQVFDAIKGQLGYVDLRLMCLVLEDEELTRKVLAKDDYLAEAIRLLKKVEKFANETGDNIRMTIASRIAEMKVLAAHLDQAGRERDLFSLSDFVEKPNQGVFVISKDMRYRVVQDPMNAVVINRLIELLDSLQKHETRKVFIVIDEFPTLAGDKPCPGIVDMFLRLRDRGVTVLIAYQTHASLERVYGKQGAAEVIGMCGNVIYLKQGDPESAEYAAKDLCVKREYERTPSTPTLGGSIGPRGENTASWSISKGVQYHERPKFSATELTSLLPADEARGVLGKAKSPELLAPPGKRYYADQSAEAWSFLYTNEEIDAIPQGPFPEPNYEKRDPKLEDDIEQYQELMRESQRLERLSDEERDALTRTNTPEVRKLWNQRMKFVDDARSPSPA